VPGDYSRRYLYPELVNVLGYSDPKFGQSGLEDGLDPILRGEEDQPAFTLWVNHLLYGQPAPGLDVRLTLDQELEFQASQLLGEQAGAIVAMDAGTGEILAMVSAPTYDPATIDEDWQSLSASEESPMLNRAVQAAYAPGSALGPFLLAAVESNEFEPELPEDISFSLEGERYDCFREPQDDENWAQLIKAGCPGALAQLGLAMGGDTLLDLFTRFGFYAITSLPLDIQTQTAPASMERPEAAATGQDGLQVSPLQMAIAACALSNQGELVEPQITFGVEQANGELETMLNDPSPLEIFSRSAAASVAQGLAVGDMPIWELTTLALGDHDQSVTWYIGGTLPGLTGTDSGKCVVVLLEANRPAMARSIGRELLLSSASN
jgi:peptidoglycan glycosyltransferase